MSNQHLSELFRKVMFEHTKLEPVEATQILTYLNMALHAHRSAFNSVRDGLIDKQVMRDMDINTAWYLSAPIFAREWRRVQRIGLFGGDFADHVNALPAPPDPASHPPKRA